jgi:hypothetical protein
MNATAHERNTDVPTYTMPPQDPHGDGTGLRFETGEHGGDYPDNMPQTITVTDAQGRWAVYLSRCEPAARSSLAHSQSRCRYEAVVDLSIEFGSAMLSLPPCQSQG